MAEPPYEVEEQPGTTLYLDPSSPPAPAAGGWWPSRAERDRVWVHLLWELVLLGGVVVVALLAAHQDSHAFTADARRQLAMQAAVFGFLATGLAFSLRAAVPNLAVGAIAGAAGVGVGRLVGNSGWGYPAAISVAILAAMAAGFVLWIVVAGFHVPAWAASLGAAALVAGLAITITEGGSARLQDQPDPARSAWLFAGLFAVLSVGGGLLWLVPGLRRGLSGVRHEGDPARRPSVGGVFGALAALVLSSGLAAVAGVLSVLRLGSVTVQPVDNATFVVLAAVLLGGVSAFGRRAGVFGTLLGVVFLTLVQWWLTLADASVGWWTVVAGATIIAGLVLTRILEAAGRKRF